MFDCSTISKSFFSFVSSSQISGGGTLGIPKVFTRKHVPGEGPWHYSLRWNGRFRLGFR